jgi:outer membrane lipoprotein SlyB
MVMATCVALALTAFTAADADAKGCLKGAAVGGIAGHEVGSGHGVAGAGIGCAVGHHEAKKKEAKQNLGQKGARAPDAGQAGSSGSSNADGRH